MTSKDPDSIDRIVGRNIRICRLQKGLTQTELADALGLTFQQVQKYEKGTNRVGSGRLLRIATFLDVPVTALFKGSYEMADTDKQSIFDQLESHIPVGCCRHSRELITMVCGGLSFSWSRKLRTTTSRAHWLDVRPRGSPWPWCGEPMGQEDSNACCRISYRLSDA